MTEEISSIKTAIEKLHSCQATYRETAKVKEEYGGQTAWEGEVHIFDIESHPDAAACYAWSSPIEGSEKRKFYAVLHIPPVDSPEKAVRASIISDYQQNNG